MTKLQKALGMGLLLLAPIGGCPCRCKPPAPVPVRPRPPWPLDVEVTVDAEGFRKQMGTVPSLEINIIGVPELEHRQWCEASMTTYWMPDNPQRLTVLNDGYAHKMTFGDEPTKTRTLGQGDAIWKRWAARRAAHLFVLVNYPRAARDAHGDSDVRRLILPWGAQAWRRWSVSHDGWAIRLGARIRVEVTPGGLRCTTLPDSE